MYRLALLLYTTVILQSPLSQLLDKVGEPVLVYSLYSHVSKTWQPHCDDKSPADVYQGIAATHDSP